MSTIQIIKKTDFYLVILVFYMLFRLWWESYIRFEDFEYWDTDIQLAGGLLVCITVWKTYRMLLLKLRINL
jgi:hypothetical protein